MTPPRIALIHALPESVVPANAAMAALWPEAKRFNLSDESLAPDLADAGRITPAITQRFLDLAHYAAGTGSKGILFTCSAFGTAIEACQTALPIPILKPNEAALDEALEAGPSIGILATFGPTIASMTQEIEVEAKRRGKTVSIYSTLADGALAALKAGDGATHDRIVAAAASPLAHVDALILAQFSMARAAALIPAVKKRRVITTPESAVRKLRDLIARG
jgi:hypothetical protein